MILGELRCHKFRHSNGGPSPHGGRICAVIAHLNLMVVTLFKLVSGKDSCSSPDRSWVVGQL